MTAKTVASDTPSLPGNVFNGYRHIQVWVDRSPRRPVSPAKERLNVESALTCRPVISMRQVEILIRPQKTATQPVSADILPPQELNRKDFELCPLLLEPIKVTESTGRRTPDADYFIHN
jgi:hypothetical protein